MRWSGEPAAASPGWRVRAELAWLVALALAVPPRAWAGPDREGGEVDEPEPSAATGAAPAVHDPVHDPAFGPRDALARQLEDQTGSVERAIAAVGDKLAAAQEARTRRIGAALRLTRPAPGDDAMAVARRGAAARLLLERDRDERALLSDEIARLGAARARLAGDAVQLPVLALPDQLARPAPGTIARHFGALEHERSRAILSRRGIDLEVEDRCPVTAPAAGTVRYAGPIRGLDQGVILDHGDYFTVVAKLGELALPVGAPIARGDRLGRAARHRVYLEVRVKLGPGGLPIDPEPLLAAPAPAPPVPKGLPVRRIAPGGHRDAPAARTR